MHRGDTSSWNIINTTAPVTITIKVKIKFLLYLIRSRDSVVGIATGYGLYDEGSEFESR
jgi:hypothetical protein